MTTLLAQIVTHARISRLALIGLAKNVGKTTTTNHLLAALLNEGFYGARELALTSLGLDGEATDAMTGLPKPRYVPQAGLLVATTLDLLRQAESDGIEVEYLEQLKGRTALGPVMLARVVQSGRIIIAGPTLLRDIRSALDRLQEHGSHLGIVDGAINRLGAASPSVTDACIVCTGASVGSTPELVARRTAAVLTRLLAPQTQWRDAYKKLLPQTRLLVCLPGSAEEQTHCFSGLAEPTNEAKWIGEHMHTASQTVFLLRGAFSEELSHELLAQLSHHDADAHAEIVVDNATRIFCHAVVLQRLAAKGLQVSVAHPIRILALTINPYTPEYSCTPQRLIDALLKELPTEHPPIVDVVSGLIA